MTGSRRRRHAVGVLAPARLAPLTVGAVVAALLLALSGCQKGPDDELVRPTVTQTSAPRPPSDLPDLPVGSAQVSPQDDVSVQDSTIRVNGTSVDLSPLRVDSWAVVPGGVFFLNRSELWFTDLRSARPTAFKDVSGLHATHGGARFAFVDHDHGANGPDGRPLPVRIVYDAATGAPLSSSYVTS